MLLPYRVMNAQDASSELVFLVSSIQDDQGNFFLLVSYKVIILLLFHPNVLSSTSEEVWCDCRLFFFLEYLIRNDIL